MIRIDLCFQLRFSHISFSDFLKGGGLPQYTILGLHSFLLHLNSQCTQKAEDLFLLYDLLYPWGKGSAEQSKGVMATDQVLSGACGFPKPACRNILLGNIWNMVEIWKRGGTSRILLRQVLGGSNISLFDGGGGGGRFCGPEVRLNNCGGQRTAECGQ